MDARAASRSRRTGRSARSRASCWRPSGPSPARSRSSSTRRRRTGRSRSTRTTSTRPTTPPRSTTYFAAATRAALVLAALRAPYRGRSTPVNAWWGSFDLAVSLFSGPARPAALRRLHHAQLDGRPGGRRRLVARRCALPARRLLRLRPSGAARASRRPRSRRPPRAGTRRSASTSSTGQTWSPPTTRTRRRSASCARPSPTAARCASGTRRWPRARSAIRRRSL